MMTRIRFDKSMLGPVFALLCAPVLAADPASGTISPANPEITYTVPATPLPNLSGLITDEYSCDATNPCDEFALSVEVPGSYASTHVIRVAAATDVEYADVDLQVSDEQGNVVYLERDNPPQQPVLFMIPESGNFTVQVVPGTPHNGASARLSLEANSALKVDGPGSADGAAGALSWALLAVLAVAGRGRRRAIVA